MGNSVRKYSVVSLALAAVLLGGVLVQSGCKDGITGPAGPAGTDTYGELTDPAVPLKVVYTMPQDKAIGPFPILTRSSSVSRPYFTVQFNKLMDKSTFASNSVKCQGSSQPVSVSLYPSYSSSAVSDLPGNIIAFYLYYSNPYSGSSGSVYYEAGKTYTVSIDTTVADLYGNRLSKNYSFSFVPEPNFRVLSTSPANNDTMISSYNGQSVVLYFNSTVSPAIFPLLTISPSLAGQWTVSSYDSTMVIFQPKSMLPYNTSYTVHLDGSAKDTRGNQLEGGYSLHFTTVPFIVSSFSPSNGSTNVSCNSYVYVYFTGQLDNSTTGGSFSISPAAAGTVSSSGSELIFFPSMSFKSGTTYTVSLTTGLKAIDGTSLSAPFRSTFTTEPFRVSSTSPSDGSNGVSNSSAIYVYFNTSIDPTSVASSFSISPNVAGRIQYSGNGSSASMYFQPAQSLNSGTTYTVTLSTNIKALDGSYLPQPYTFSFTTQPFLVQSIQPYGGSSSIANTSPVQLYFSDVIDTASARRAWSISPSVNGTMTFDYSGTSFTFTPIPKFAAGTLYTVSLSTEMKSKSGAHLAALYQSVFMTDYFQLTSAYPSSGSTYVSRYNQFSLSFNDAVDTSSVRRSVSISPAVSGTFGYYGGIGYGTVTFSPTLSYAANTACTVTVRTSLRSTGGDTLAFPYVFGFTTGQ
jgi:hypothetical protein